MNKMHSIFLTTLLSILLASCDTPIISDKPFDQGLLAHFKLDENNQSLLKDSTKNISDTQMFYHLHNSETSPRKEVQFKDGVDGQAMVFDGYSTYGQINQSEIKVSGYEFSIASWVAPRAYNYAPQNLKDDRLQALASQYYKDDSLSMGFTLGYKREGKFSFGVGTNHGWFQLWDEGSPLKQYEWNHILATFNGNKGEMSLYLNGRIINRLELPVGTYIEPCDEPLTIGKNTITSSSGDSLMGIVSGLMDDLRLYSRAVPFKDYQSYYQSLLVDGKIKPLDFNEVWLQNILTDDAYKPQYHGGPYEHWMNEPHAPFYYKGLYHLFYQANPNGPYFNEAQGIAWGHLTSPDMVNWTPRKEVIVPQAGTVAPDGIWSGGSILDKDGNPVLFFTAGDYAHPGIISNQNIGLAYPKDLNDPYLTEWIVADQLAIEQKPGQGRTGEFRDAHVIKEGDDYYLLVGSGDENSSRGTVVVYHTNVAKHNYFFNWDYKGHLFDYPSNDAKYGTVWELPVLLPLKDENGNLSDRYMLAISPAPATTADNNIIYWTGMFDKESVRFIPDFTDPRRMDYGRNVFTGPSGFVDPLSGQSILFSILQSQREAVDLAQSGWTHNVGLTRELFYDSNRQDLGIRILDAVIDNLATGVIIDAADIDEESLNGQLNQFKSDMYALEIKLTNLTNRFEIRTRKSQNGEEYTSVYVDPIEQLMGVNTMMNQNNARLTSGDFNGVVTGLDEVTLTLYVDRSQIEVVVNDQKTISSRSYPKDLAANGLSLHFAGGGTIEQIVIYQLASIYQ